MNHILNTNVFIILFNFNPFLKLKRKKIINSIFLSFPLLSRLKSKNILLTITIVCYLTNVQAFTELANDQPIHFETHEIDENNKLTNNNNDQFIKNESPVSLMTNEVRNLESLTSNIERPTFELPPSQFTNRQSSNSNLQQPANALETALSGYGQSPVRKTPQFQSVTGVDSPFNSNINSNLNSQSIPTNYQRQPQMISVLSGGASLHQR